MQKVDKSSKYTQEYLNKLFQYSLGEDIANSATHVIGSFFGLYAIINLTWVAARYGNWVDTAAYVFYGLTILFMFVMSSIYHSMLNPTARSVFKKMDHIAIYWLILGTYTPFVFSLLKSTEAYVIYGFLVALTIFGVIFKSFYAGKYKIVSTLVYIIMGWAIVWVFPQLSEKISYNGILFLSLGGLSFTFGAILYAFGKFRYLHMVWHIFVILGVVFHFIAVAFFILQYR